MWSPNVPGRTFAVIELAVQDTFRRSGIGRELHTHLLAGLTEERATLLVRPDAIAARSAYLSWEYRPIGRLQPFANGPTYDAMIKELPRVPTVTVTPVVGARRSIPTEHGDGRPVVGRTADLELVAADPLGGDGR